MYVYLQTRTFDILYEIKKLIHRSKKKYELLKRNEINIGNSKP